MENIKLEQLCDRELARVGLAGGGFYLTAIQKGNELYTRSFSSKEQAISAGEKEYRQNKDDDDFRGVVWSVWEKDGFSEDDDKQVWSKSA